MLRTARLIKNALEGLYRQTLRASGAKRPDKFPPETVFISESNKHIYCGYYDVTPFNADHTQLLALKIDAPNTSPHDRGTKAEIGYINLPDRRFIGIAQSSAWNWQQGCRQQWLPFSNDTIIHNDFLDGRFVSIVRKITQNTLTRIYDYPFYAMHKSGGEALSLDFARLHRFRRGYGYHNMKPHLAPAPADEGLWRMDMDSGTRELLVSLEQLAAFEPQQEMHGAFHYINHLQWAPDGKTIVFFHLWYRDGQKKASRFMILSEDGELSTFGPTIRPSHTGWSKGGQLLLTGIRSERQELYHLYRHLDRGKAISIDIRVDGHPDFITEDTFLSDTYPDKHGHQSLYISDLKGKRETIASFYLPPDYTGEMRCDLHPRLSPDNKFCAVDVVKNGFRAVAIIPLEKPV